MYYIYNMCVCTSFMFIYIISIYKYILIHVVDKHLFSYYTYSIYIIDINYIYVNSNINVIVADHFDVGCNGCCKQLPLRHVASEAAASYCT